jgi:hypothetical protein
MFPSHYSLGIIVHTMVWQDTSLKASPALMQP